LKIGLAAATLILASTWAAKADGIDPVLKMGGGGGSPNCVSNGVSYQATTPNGVIDSSNGVCVNNTGFVVTSFSFDILNSPGLVIVPTLDCLLAPFQAGCPNADPEDVSQDWTVSCTTIDNGLIESCTASRPNSQCQDSDSECDQTSPTGDATKCADSHFYIQFGILPGCDLSVSTVDGTFPDGSTFDIVPNGVTPASLVPEPASLTMLLFGLGGLTFLRRRFAC
jgi:hypothetical protein